MSSTKKTAIEPTREDNYSAWYLEVIRAAELSESSDVRGCMVIKPWGYAVWENIKRELDERFKATGHSNAYFPLFIPLSYLQKEADHVEGFAKECAVVTHHRLEQNSEGILTPAGELEEPLIVRPTSETIIGASYAKWVQSYRDLPILINQWANVVRWEMRTRPFLRTAEFLWQEGHTVHATSEEAIEETLTMLSVYKDFAENVLAIPVITGEKSEAERFPGAVATYSIEAMMQDRKALQAGTSHFLGQNFAKASKIIFQSKEGKEEFAWTTSWGVSTRLIGALIMVHADDNGMVIPPKVASAHIAIIPIYRNDEEREIVLKHIKELQKKLTSIYYSGRKIAIEVDDRDLRGGEKNWYWIKKGVPIKLEIGMKDIEKNSVAMLRRDSAELKKEFVATETFVDTVTEILDDIQANLYNKALKFMQQHTHIIDNKEEFYQFFTPKNIEQPEIHAGFAFSSWCGSKECEEKIKEDLKVTVRNMPDSDEKFTHLANREQIKECICCGKEGKIRTIFAKSY